MQEIPGRAPVGPPCGSRRLVTDSRSALANATLGGMATGQARKDVLVLGYDPTVMVVDSSAERFSFETVTLTS